MNERFYSQIGSRILVIGCPGSGKSVFSTKLHAFTGIPLIHLDNIWWKADRTHITRAAFDRRLDEILKTDQWILDGNYSRTLELRIQHCDTIFFLDYDTETCMRGIEERVGTKRPDIPWVEQTLDSELVQLVQGFQKEQRPAIYELMNQYPDKNQFVFSCRRQAEEWLSAMTYQKAENETG